MNTTIPAQIVSVVRAAVLTELGEAAAQIEEASLGYQKERHPEYFTGPLEQFDTIRALLDRIGWSECDIDIDIDIDAYRRPLAKALKNRLVADRSYISDTMIEPSEREATERDIDGIEDFLTVNGLRGGDA
jgi:hypothetical protein